MYRIGGWRSTFLWYGNIFGVTINKPPRREITFQHLPILIFLKKKKNNKIQIDSAFESNWWRVETRRLFRRVTETDILQRQTIIYFICEFNTYFDIEYTRHYNKLRAINRPHKFEKEPLFLLWSKASRESWFHSSIKIAILLHFYAQLSSTNYQTKSQVPSAKRQQ